MESAAKQHIKLLRISIDENLFPIRCECYKQLKGAALGDPFSINDTLIAKLKTELNSAVLKSIV